MSCRKSIIYVSQKKEISTCSLMFLQRKTKHEFLFFISAYKIIYASPGRLLTVRCLAYFDHSKWILETLEGGTYGPMPIVSLPYCSPCLRQDHRPEKGGPTFWWLTLVTVTYYILHPNVKAIYPDAFPLSFKVFRGFLLAKYR